MRWIVLWWWLLMGVSHAYTSPVADGTVTSVVRPSDWNSAHILSLAASELAASGALTSQSNQNVTASNGGFAFQTLSFSNANNFSFGTSAGSAIVGSYTVPTVTNSSWSISDAATSGTVGRLAFTNLNGVTLSLSSGTGGLHTIVGSHNALTTAMASDASTQFVQANATFNGTNASGTIASDGISVSVAAPGGASTYSNYYQPITWDENSATSTLSLSNLGVQPFTVPVNLSFGQINFIGSGSVPTTSASNSYSARLTNSTQAHRMTGSWTLGNSNFVDLYFFSRGTGNFSTELETIFSTRNTWATHFHLFTTGSATLTNTAGGSLLESQQVTMTVSYPMITSGQVINGATSHTTWGMGYTTWTSSASNTTTQTISTSAARTVSVASTYPGTTAWSSNKMIPFGLASTMSPGEWWLGMVRYSSTSSSSSTSAAFTGAAGTGNSFSTTYNGTAFTITAQHTWAGQTATIASSLGWLGFAAQNSMAPAPGLGTFSGTYSGNTTYINNAGNPNGAIAISDLRTQVSFFTTWMQLASNRV